MISASFIGRAVRPHPAIILAASASAAWFISGLFAGTSSPAEAKPPPKPPRAPVPHVSPFDSLPAQLPSRIDTPSVAQTVPTPAPAVVAAVPGSAGIGGGWGGGSGGNGGDNVGSGASQKTKPHGNQQGQPPAEPSHPAYTPSHVHGLTPQRAANPPSYGGHPMETTPAVAAYRAPVYVPPAPTYRPTPFGIFGGFGSSRLGSGHLGGGRHR